MSLCPAYVERGTGPVAVVMLHGIGGNKAAWTHQLEGFAARGYRAVAWDAPGYGESATVAPYTMATLADALAALIAHLGAARTVVLGHSMGGMIAQELAVRAPVSAAGLILFATSPAFGKPDGAWQQEFLDARLRPLDEGVPMARIAEQLMASMIPAGPGRATAIELMRAVPPATYRSALAALVGFDRRAALGAIAVPTLVLAAATDTTAPAAVMAKMAERIPGAAFVTLPAAGHLANLETPAAFDDAVLAYLERHFPVRLT